MQIRPDPVTLVLSMKPTYCRIATETAVAAMVQVVDWKPLSWRLVATNKLRLDQGQLVLNGARFEQDFLHLSPNISLRYHAAVRSKGANSWIKVRSSLLVLNAIAVHGECRAHQTHQLYRCHQLGLRHCQVGTKNPVSMQS